MLLLLELHWPTACTVSPRSATAASILSQAAVKALAWCPFQSNLLATGGGTADRCIKFWNTHTGAVLSSIDTGSQVCCPCKNSCSPPQGRRGLLMQCWLCCRQVCSLQWSRHEREILSSHGYSKNQLCLWKYPSLVKVRTALLPMKYCPCISLNMTMDADG